MKKTKRVANRMKRINRIKHIINIVLLALCILAAPAYARAQNKSDAGEFSVRVGTTEIKGRANIHSLEEFVNLGHKIVKSVRLVGEAQGIFFVYYTGKNGSSGYLKYSYDESDGKILFATIDI